MLLPIARSAVRIACAVWILGTGMVSCMASMSSAGGYAWLVWLVVAVVPIAVLDLISWGVKKLRLAGCAGRHGNLYV